MTSAVLAQRNKNRPNRNKNKNRPKATQAPKLIPVPAQEEPGLADNRQEIANMLAFKLDNYGYDSISFTDILSSGCWCNMINNYDKRHGHPVGSMDTACRAHSHCYKCLSMDYECTEALNTYQVLIDPKTDEFTCEKNSNPCAIRACQCDVELVNNLVLAAGDESYNIPSLTEYGGFDPAQSCVATGSGIAGKPDQCCGDYPKRFPFHSASGGRECCNGKTFNTKNLECCSTGEIKGIGSCDVVTGY